MFSFKFGPSFLRQKCDALQLTQNFELVWILNHCTLIVADQVWLKAIQKGDSLLVNFRFEFRLGREFSLFLSLSHLIHVLYVEGKNHQILQHLLFFIGLKFGKIHYRIICSSCFKTEKRKQEKKLKETAAFCDKATEETKPRNGVVDKSVVQ